MGLAVRKAVEALVGSPPAQESDADDSRQYPVRCFLAPWARRRWMRAWAMLRV